MLQSQKAYADLAQMIEPDFFEGVTTSSEDFKLKNFFIKIDMSMEKMFLKDKLLIPQINLIENTVSHFYSKKFSDCPRMLIK